MGVFGTGKGERGKDRERVSSADLEKRSRASIDICKKMSFLFFGMGSYKI
jgi:hypothetical protein